MERNKGTLASPSGDRRGQQSHVSDGSLQSFSPHAGLPLRASCLTLGRRKGAAPSCGALHQRSEVLCLQPDLHFHRSTTSSQLHEKRCIIETGKKKNQRCSLRGLDVTQEERHGKENGLYSICGMKQREALFHLQTQNSLKLKHAQGK